jgi:3-phosphoshikimate 1-carboxyvinyltransferase
MFLPIFQPVYYLSPSDCRKLENGLEIHLVGEVTSRSYIEMTLDILSRFGIKNSFEGNTIKVEPFIENHASAVSYEVESDWSSGILFLLHLCIGKRSHSSEKFLQRVYSGDSAIAKIYEDFFGITTTFSEDEHKITLQPQPDFSFS